MTILTARAKRPGSNPGSDRLEQKQRPDSEGDEEPSLEGLDRRRGCCYVPMDLFLDHATVESHFHVRAIRARRARVSEGRSGRGRG